MVYKNTTLKSTTKALTLDELFLDKENQERIDQLIEEFTYIDALKKLNIPVDNKILLHGYTGCGKTATAKAIGLALNKKVNILNLGGFVSSRLGETAKNLSEVFRQTSLEREILFIDEFDFIGKLRDYDDKDSGEMKRLVNSLIQQFDALNENGLLICATNHIEVIDSALLRRFQIRLKYVLPSDERLDSYYDSLLAQFPENLSDIKRSYGISFAEAKDTVYQQVKANVIQAEKLKKHLLFSYGTLKFEKVQLENYGRKLVGSDDELLGFKLDKIQITDPTVIAKSETNVHPIALKSTNENDKISGIVFEITGEELIQTDKYEVSNYKRVLQTTKQGKEVWIYVGR